MSKRILYFECKTGAAGDMLMGALYELLSEEKKGLFLSKINACDCTGRGQGTSYRYEE